MEYGPYIIGALVLIFIFVFIYVYLVNFTDYFQKKEPIKYPEPAFESLPVTIEAVSSGDTSSGNPPDYNISISTTSISTNEGDVYINVYNQGYDLDTISPSPTKTFTFGGRSILSRTLLIYPNGTSKVTFSSGVDPTVLPSTGYKVFAEILVAPSQSQISTFLEKSSG